MTQVVVLSACRTPIAGYLSTRPPPNMHVSLAQLFEALPPADSGMSCHSMAHYCQMAIRHHRASPRDAGEGRMAPVLWASAAQVAR
jgi:hypothetical protein